ncbi:SMC-Scp complex subunit ScpB [Elusimicrobiota bacterium]
MSENQPRQQDIIEAMLFASDIPLTLDRIKETLGLKEKDDSVFESIDMIKDKYSSTTSPIVIIEVANGWQMATNPMYTQWIKKLFTDRMEFRLSHAALETLAIIAYREPITRAEIEEIRGVETIASLETLIEKGLIRVAGRKETVGRPMLYKTTPDFLKQFGLKNLEALPQMNFALPEQPKEDEAEEKAEEKTEELPAQTPPSDPAGTIGQK